MFWRQDGQNDRRNKVINVLTDYTKTQSITHWRAGLGEQYGQGGPALNAAHQPHAAQQVRRHCGSQMSPSMMSIESILSTGSPVPRVSGSRKALG
jgi:hypothetical protein